MLTVAERIKIRREELGMTQSDLAEALGLSDKSSISKIEKSGNDITLKNIERIAAALDVTPSYLMGWTNIVSDVLKDDVSLPPVERYMHMFASMYNENQLYENLLKAAHGNSPENIQLAIDMLMRLKGDKDNY